MFPEPARVAGTGSIYAKPDGDEIIVYLKDRAP